MLAAQARDATFDDRRRNQPGPDVLHAVAQCLRDRGVVDRPGDRQIHQLAKMRAALDPVAEERELRGRYLPAVMQQDRLQDGRVVEHLVLGIVGDEFRHHHARHADAHALRHVLGLLGIQAGHPP